MVMMEFQARRVKNDADIKYLVEFLKSLNTELVDFEEH